MNMKINEAMRIIEESGLLLERIKKYRTTADERVFRDTRSEYDNDSIKSRIRKIAKEEGMEVFIKDISFDRVKGNPKESSTKRILVEFSNIGEFGRKLVRRLSKAVGSDEGIYSDTLYFNFEDIRKQSRTTRSFRQILRKMLNDRFGVPDDAFDRQVFYDAEEWLDNAKKNYDIIEEYVEDKQYGGIHDLNYRKYRQAISDAMDAVNSPDNADKYVTNQYGFRKRIDEIYAKFRKFCRLFKREFDRQRGNLTKPRGA